MLIEAGKNARTIHRDPSVSADALEVPVDARSFIHRSEVCGADV
jgi:hypothetical protein